MKKKNLIIPALLALVIGLITLGIINSGKSFYHLQSSQSLSSKWANSERIERFHNSHEHISYEDVPVVVELNSIRVGDTMAVNPLVIDLNKEGIEISKGFLGAQCDVEFSKDIYQRFETASDQTRIITVVQGNIDYSLRYKVYGLPSSPDWDERVVRHIINAIYEEVKEKILSGIPLLGSAKPSDGERPPYSLLNLTDDI